MEYNIKFDYEKVVYNSISKIKSFQSEKVFKIINDAKNIEVFCTVEKIMVMTFLNVKYF